MRQTPRYHTLKHSLPIIGVITLLVSLISCQQDSISRPSPSEKTAVLLNKCGGLTPDNQQQSCKTPQEYCYWEIKDMCGAADAPGVCKPKPEICTQEYAPVCGCDGQTYANACMAAGHGVSVAVTGECAS